MVHSWCRSFGLELYSAGVTLNGVAQLHVVSNGKVWDSVGNPWVGRGINVAETQIYTGTRLTNELTW